VSSALDSASSIAVRGRSFVAVALLFLFALPAFAVRSWSRAYADGLADGVAAWLVAVVPTPPVAPAEAVAESTAEEPPFDRSPDMRAAALDSKRGRLPSRRRTAPVSGIRISAAQVLALAARRAMPQAVFVKATTQRPAGLQLSGVSALGVGMQDGDVLTEAAGQKASSVAAVVGVVLAARARQATEISGRFYRGSAPFSLTVEQPYPKSPVPG
jgi:hypothetical protein